MGQAILITDGTERSALATARALVSSGYRVHVAAPRRYSLAAVSRGVHCSVLEQTPHTDPAGYVAALGGLVTAHGIDVLLPMTDASVEAVLEHRRALPPDGRAPVPRSCPYHRASDKLPVLELARAAGFMVPETVVLDCADQGDPWPDGLFPAVVKPHRSRGGRGRRRRR